MVAMDKDEFYRDILEGMAVYTRSALQRDVLSTLVRHDEPALAQALNKNQIASKMWLADTLAESVGRDLGNVLILGGWFGVLGAVLLHDPRFAISRVVSLDIDPRCAAIALAVNATHVRAGKFTALTADMLDYDYAGEGASPAADLVVNTSCEHVEDLDRWYRRIPAGQLLALQSNDYFACTEHVNCVPDLAAFRGQVPMRDVLYAGERKFRRYVRFMLIGRK
ncbi:MAG TPA: class I SAM-dependent methyltransferase [Casimicrobiaceae bacterium]|nr:class I SAM-dependent methyltransferase [Casimicrobiaceae bacterium]